MQKLTYSLICLAFTSCTPVEVQVAEEILHEASVAENAIENDLRSPQKPPGTIYSDQPKAIQTKLVNQRQYPPRKEYKRSRDTDRGA